MIVGNLIRYIGAKPQPGKKTKWKAKIFYYGGANDLEDVIW